MYSNDIFTHLYFAEKSPPTILVKLPNGSSSVDFDSNQVVIYPGSIVHLECLFKRHDGHPEWTWSTGQQHRLTGIHYVSSLIAVHLH